MAMPDHFSLGEPQQGSRKSIRDNRDLIAGLELNSIEDELRAISESLGDSPGHEDTQGKLTKLKANLDKAYHERQLSFVHVDAEIDDGKSIREKLSQEKVMSAECNDFFENQLPEIVRQNNELANSLRQSVGDCLAYIADIREGQGDIESTLNQFKESFDFVFSNIEALSEKQKETLELGGEKPSPVITKLLKYIGVEGINGEQEFRIKEVILDGNKEPRSEIPQDTEVEENAEVEGYIAIAESNEEKNYNNPLVKPVIDILDDMGVVSKRGILGQQQSIAVSEAVESLEALHQKFKSNIDWGLDYIKPAGEVRNPDVEGQSPQAAAVPDSPSNGL